MNAVVAGVALVATGGVVLVGCRSEDAGAAELSCIGTDAEELPADAVAPNGISRANVVTVASGPRVVELAFADGELVAATAEVSGFEATAAYIREYPEACPGSVAVFAVLAVAAGDESFAYAAEALVSMRELTLPVAVRTGDAELTVTATVLEGVLRDEDGRVIVITTPP